jgi:hypothetical protein
VIINLERVLNNSLFSLNTHVMKKFKDFTPTEILDEVLEFMYPITENLDVLTIGMGLQNTRNIFISQDLETVLTKLIKDGYVSMTKVVHPTDSTIPETAFYTITWEGKLYYLTGGYNQLFEEKERLKILEAIQNQQRKALYFLNLVIAAGTSITAVYYALEILRTFGFI